MNARLLVVDRDARYREWLRNHLGALFPEGSVTAIDGREFESRLEVLTRHEFDLVIFVAQFGYSPEDPHSEGLEWLRQPRGCQGFPGGLAGAAGATALAP